MFILLLLRLLLLLGVLQALLNVLLLSHQAVACNPSGAAQAEAINRQAGKAAAAAAAASSSESPEGASNSKAGKGEDTKDNFRPIFDGDLRV